jgi:hypothetical protein
MLPTATPAKVSGLATLPALLGNYPFPMLAAPITGAEGMARRKKNNQGAALAAVEWVLICARRVAIHSPERDDLAQAATVPGEKLYRLRLALQTAGVDMGKARNFSAGAIKANKTIKANKGKRN